MMWVKSYEVIGFDIIAASTIIEGNGRTILTSESSDANGLILNDNIDYNKLFHIDTSGDVLWTWKGQQNEEGIAAISLLKTGGHYYYITRPSFEEQNTFHYKPQIVCRDESFNLKWREDYGEFYYNNAFTSLAFGPDSFLYAAGYIPDGWTWGRVCKIDPDDGEVIWDARDTAFVIPGWGSRNRMEGITVLPSGSVIAVGYTVDHTYHENGLLYKVTADGCIDTLCTIVAIEDLIRDPDHRVSMYPNPAVSDIFIEVPLTLPFSSLHIYSLEGKPVDQIPLISGMQHIIIDPARYTPGMYIWQARSPDGKMFDSGKIIIKPEGQ